jgi:hypothetical protein
MRSPTFQRAESSRDFRLRLRPGHNALRFAVLGALCAGSFFSAGTPVNAQTSAAQTNQAQNNQPSSPSTPPAHKHVHPHKKPAAAVPVPQPAPPPAPVLPPPPDWPTNDPPVAATVVYDSRGLFIAASNSSLARILKDVSTDTGAKVEGLGADPRMTDQRIFGTYGPGPARDVLSQLLDGSGYNILMVGDRGQGTPRRIVLSAQGGGAAQSAANSVPPPPSNDDTDADQPAPEPEVEQPLPQPIPSPTGPPVPIRTPQQIMQEVQERQERQQQQQQQNPQN